MSDLSPRAQLYLLKHQFIERAKRSKLATFYPDEGPLRRELYPKHLQFFRNGALDRERLFLAANRVGKSEGAGGYETVLHATGGYPDWWEGRRFDRPVSALVAGTTGKKTRDTVQAVLLGPFSGFGTGLIPGDKLLRTTAKSGIAEAVDTIQVRHVSGGQSRIVIRSYDQKREAFEGDEHHVVWLDEEPPMDIYGECLIRTMTTGGVVMLTFTPLAGWSDVVRAFLQPDDDE